MYIRYSKPKELSDVGQLIDKGKLEEALQKLNKLEEKEDLTSYDKISCHILKSSLKFELGNYKDALKFAEQACRESQELRDYLHLFDAYNVKTFVIHWGFGWTDKALDLIAKSEDLLKTLSQEPPIELKKREAFLAFNKGYAYLEKCDMTSAIENMKRSLKLREEIGNEKEIGLSFGQLGAFYLLYKGDWNQALKYNEKAYELARKTDFKYLISLSLWRFGLLYDIKGDLARSLKYFKQSLELSKEMNHKFLITEGFHGIGWIYQGQGDFDRALEYYEKCLEIKEEMGQDEFSVLDTLFYLCIIKKDLGRAQHYFDRMKQLQDQEKAWLVEIFLRLDKALLMKMSPIASKQAKAKEILKEIVEKKINVEAFIRALLSLCDLLLKELRDTNNLEILKEIQSYINQILDSAKNQNSYSLMAEAHLLQAKSEVLTLDLKRAQSSLTQAQHIAENYGLNQLAERISVEQDELFDQTSKWEALRKSKATIAELIKLSHFDEQLPHMLRKRYF